MKNEYDHVKKQVQHVFSRHAGKYVTSQTHAQGEDLALLEEWLQPEPQWHALDIATGGGHAVRTIAPLCHMVIATDLTMEMLQAAGRHLRASGVENVCLVRADAEDLPFPDASFDLVTCRIAPHHFPDPERFVLEAARVLRPGGLFLLIDNVSPETESLARFMNELETLRDPSHVRCPAISEWQEWLAKYGLTELRSRLRKKTLSYAEWVDRTAESTEQIKQVELYLRAASAETKAYYAVLESPEGEILSWQTDEWMILCRKEMQQAQTGK